MVYPKYTEQDWTSLLTTKGTTLRLVLDFHFISIFLILCWGEWRVERHAESVVACQEAHAIFPLLSIMTTSI